MSSPMDLENAVVAAWHATADELPGVLAIVDHYRAEPLDAAMAEAMAKSAAKEHILLAMMAGRASAPDAHRGARRRRHRGPGPGDLPPGPCPHPAPRRAAPACSGASRPPSRPDRALPPAPGDPGPDASLPPTASGPGSSHACCRTLSPDPRILRLLRDDPWIEAGPLRDDGDMTEPRAGMLLVATPALLDPNFADSVVLLLDVDDQGALGVVLNRPSAVRVADVLDGWGEVVAEPEVLFQGGPVSTQGALAVGTLRSEDDVPVGFREVEGRLGLVDLDTPVELLEGSLDGLADLRRVRRMGRGPAGRRDRGGQLVRRARRSRPTSSAWTRATSGATCCAASPASWRGTPRARSTRT